MRISRLVLIPTYLVLGPPLGALAFWAVTLVPVALLATLERGYDARAAAAGLKLLGLYVPYSYLLGFFPALGTATVHALFLQRLGGWRLRARLASVTLGGAAITYAFSVLVAKTSAWGDEVAPLAAAGGISAGLVAGLLERIARLRRPAEPREASA